MPRTKLTARTVGTLPCPEKGVLEYSDDSQGAVPWFSLRVSAEGRRTFTLCYRVGRRRRRVGLGRWPIVSLADARERARELLGEVAAGDDPAQTRDDLRHADDFQTLVTRFVEFS